MEISSYDTETTGLSPYRGHRMFSYSTCDANGNTAVTRLDGTPTHRRQGRRKLRDFLIRKHDVAKVAHNWKFDASFSEALLGEEIPRTTRIYDTNIIARLFRSNLPTYKLKPLMWILARFPMDDEDDVKRHAAGSDYSTVPADVMDKYQERDAIRTMLLYQFFAPKMATSPRVRDIYDWEEKLLWVTMDIEKRGVVISHKAARRLISDLNDKIERVQQQIEDALGFYVNPNSEAIADVLYGQLKLPVLGYTPTHRPSTDKRLLLELREKHPHPLIDLTLQYRSYTRGKGAIRGYIEASDSGGNLHPTVNTNGARTGRESCENPNLQNVEKVGRLDNPFPVPARSIFRVRPGYVIFLMDFSGIELRLLVHFSRDPVMMRAFLEGENPHEIAAEIWYANEWRTSAGARRVEMYNAAKSGNFLIHYLGGMPKLARVLLLPLAEVRHRMYHYNAMFPGARTLPRTIAAYVKEHGYVETTFGRRIATPRQKAYVGTNWLIQATAAEVLKRTQVKVAEYLDWRTDGQAGIILPVHDELLIEYPRSLLPKWRTTMQEVARIMVDFDCFRVPLKVGCKMTTTTWDRAREVAL